MVETGFTKAADPVEGTIKSAIAGGIGSVLGGGKFANGAQTGAFSYLFNQAMHDDRPRSGGGIPAPFDLRPLGQAMYNGLDALYQSMVDIYDSIAYNWNYRERALTAAGIDPASDAAKNYEVHHVVQQGHLGAAVGRANLAAVGIGVHDLENLVVLPKPHQVVHTDLYRTSVNAVTTVAVPGGRAAMTGVLNGVKAALTTKGTFP
jgi:hypothetical protein